MGCGDAAVAARVDPIQIPNAAYAPVAWDDLTGWRQDDPRGAADAFRVSCKPILAVRNPQPSDKALGDSLREPCHALRSMTPTTADEARAFFERHFVALRIAKLGDTEGFVTGYYEPVIEGARERSEQFTVPVYRRPSNLFVRGQTQANLTLPNKGEVFRKIGRRKLVPYFDRGEIEDGAIAGRGLEVVWLKSQTDLLFTQIQGSARVKLVDGGTVRINYEAHNGFPYTPVGRVLIERNIVPRDQMSMQRIRQWMDANPDGAKELRRANRSYVFFREVKLGEKDEAVGAQGVSLTPGRSIAADRNLHVYGTPFFISADLPVPDEKPTPFARLMIAQDTGSAILGPARADLYFGAGDEAGRIAGRLRHPAAFAILVPKALDPLVAGRTMPLPQARPVVEAAKEIKPAPPRAKRRIHHRRWR